MLANEQVVEHKFVYDEAYGFDETRDSGEDDEVGEAVSWMDGDAVAPMRNDSAASTGHSGWSRIVLYLFGVFALGFVSSLLILQAWPTHAKNGSSPLATGASLQAGGATGNLAGTSMPANQIEVDVQGDVRRPGVYTLPLDGRVQDAVTAAGGYQHGADAKSVNEAAPLTDGAEITIPNASATDLLTAETGAPTSNSGSGAGSAPSGASGGKAAPPTGGQAQQVDLNTATQETLQTLPDIGPSRAQAIIAYRTQHGPFLQVVDVRHVHGIGPTIYSRIAPFLFVR